jgi:hypothetical protein
MRNYKAKDQSMSFTCTEDHLVEQPAVQLMQHELGWEVVNCYDEWSGGVSNQNRDGKREVVLVLRLGPALQRLNPDLPAEAIEGAEVGILNYGFWILNGRGRRPKAPRLNFKLNQVEANREIERSGFPLAVGPLVFKQSP